MPKNLRRLLMENPHNESVEPTPPSFAFRSLLGSLFILFSKRGCSPRRSAKKDTIK
jgi:hypothetical protein